MISFRNIVIFHIIYYILIIFLFFSKRSGCPKIYNFSKKHRYLIHWHCFAQCIAQDWPRPLQELSENCETSFFARLQPTLSSATTTCNWIGLWLIPSKYTVRLLFLPLGYNLRYARKFYIQQDWEQNIFIKKKTNKIIEVYFNIEL